MFELEFMLARQRRFTEMTSLRYPLPAALVHRYAPVLCWDALSQNEAIDWDLEQLALNPATVVTLALDEVEALLAAGSIDASSEAREPSLEAQIARAPEQLDGYEVYADWLEARGDEQGELIHLMCGAERGLLPLDRAEQAARAYARRRSIGRPLRWRKGFVHKAAFFRGFDNWRDLLHHRVFALIEELRIADGVDYSFGNFDRGPIDAHDCELLASFPNLRRLALHIVEIPASSSLRELRAVTELDLYLSTFDDLASLAGMPALRSLSVFMYEDTNTDLGALAELPELRQLNLCGLARADLSTLRGCERLETLWLDNLADKQLEQLVALPGPRHVLLDERTELEPLRARYPSLTFEHARLRSTFVEWSCFDGEEDADWAQPPDGFYDEIA